MSSFEELRSFRRIYTVRSVLGYSGRKNWMVCPLPQHRHSNDPTPSFSMYYDRDGVERFKCHGNCGLKGDVIDLAGYLHVAGYDPKNIESVLRAVSVLGNKFEISTAPKKVRRDLLRADAWREYHPPGVEAHRYAQLRGLTRETVKKFKIGQRNEYMAIPTFENEKLIGIKFRAMYPGSVSLRFFTEKGGRSGLFNFDSVLWSDRPVLVVKGEIPAMLLDQYDILACAPTGGEKMLVDEYSRALAFCSRRVVVGDNDRDPEIREKMQTAARERADTLHAELRFPPKEYKDIDEWILADDTAIQTIRSWI
jgi:hypothetical protein